MAFQTALCKTQIGLEDTFYQLAEMCDEPAVLICDRGCMDGSAYIAPGEWDQMLTNIGQSNVDLRDGMLWPCCGRAVAALWPWCAWTARPGCVSAGR